MERIWIANGLLVSPTGSTVDVRQGSVLIENGRIATIAPAGSPSPDSAQVIDASEMLVIPGFVNAHVHSHGVLSKWCVDGLPLEIWSPYVAAGRAWSPEAARLSALLVGIDCLQAGVTCLLDHALYNGPLFDSAARAYLDIGIRVVMAPSVVDLPFHETIPHAQVEIPQDLQRVFWAESRPSAKEILDHTIGCIERWHGVGNRLSILVGPSAPLRCSDELLRGLVRIARDFQVGMHTHFLETKGQALMARNRYGMRLTEYLEKLGFLTNRTSLAHAVWIEEEEVPLLAKHGVTVVHNPLSNLLLGSGIMPWLALREAGVNIGLGTDGSNSGGHHSLFEAMRLAAALPRIAEANPDRWPTAEQVFTSATLGGARALGLEDRIGSIEVGKQADLVLLKRSSTSLTPLNEAVRQLVFCERGESVEAVLVGGRIVVQGRRIRTVDADGVIAEAGRMAEDSWGAGAFRTFWWVTFPLSIPGVVAGSLIVFALSVSSFVTPTLLGGPWVKVLAYLAWEQNMSVLDWPFAAAISVILLVVTCAIMFAYNRVIERRLFVGVFQ